MPNFAKKLLVLTIITILIVVSIILFDRFRSSQLFGGNLESITRTVGIQPSPPFEESLEQFIRQTIIDDQNNLSKQGYRSPDGSIIIRLPSGPPESQAYSWLNDPYISTYISIWKYEKGALQPASHADLERVRRDGNAFIFVFIIQKIVGTESFIDLATYYPETKNTEGFSDGGNAAHYLFEYVNQNWLKKNEDVYLEWD